VGWAQAETELKTFPRDGQKVFFLVRAADGNTSRSSSVLTLPKEYVQTFAAYNADFVRALEYTSVSGGSGEELRYEFTSNTNVETVNATAQFLSEILTRRPIWVPGDLLFDARAPPRGVHILVRHESVEQQESY